MKKIKVSADTVLSILTNIMHDSEINYTITDQSAPIEWQNKTVQEALNVEYYTYKHRPFDTETLIRELLSKGYQTNSLYSLNRSFCLLSLSSTERVFSNQTDTVTVTANLEYWVQSDKVKLLEDMFEDIAIETNGIRIPVQIADQERMVLIALNSLDVSEIQDTSEFGQMSVCEIEIQLVFTPNVRSLSDYSVEFEMTDADGTSYWEKLPITSISFSTSMNQRAIPLANRPSNVSEINLSSVKTFVLVFDGYYNDFIELITGFSVQGGIILQSGTNNMLIRMKIQRGEQTFLHNCVINEHTIVAQDDVGHEVHKLILNTRGVIDGAT